MLFKELLGLEQNNKQRSVPDLMNLDKYKITVISEFNTIHVEKYFNTSQ